MSVAQLGYLGFNVADPVAWAPIARDLMGLMPMEAEASFKEAPVFYRMDERHHRLALYPADSDSLAYIGWETSSRREMERIAEAVAQSGINVAASTEEERAERRVSGLVKFTDPFGFPVEISWGPQLDGSLFHSPLMSAGFVTGGLGMGHVALHVEDPSAAADFYIDKLGFEMTDTLIHAGVGGCFLRCNPRAHSLVFIEPIPQNPPPSVNHFMLEGGALGDVGRAYDRCQAMEVPLALSIGQHVNDDMTSFYFVSPSGFAIELGYGCSIIERDEDWVVRHFTAGSIWGHKMGGEHRVSVRGLSD